jgi:hypothetical protein
MKKVFLANFLLAMVTSLVLMATPGFSEDNPHARIANEWRKSISSMAPGLESQEISRVVSCVEKKYLVSGMPRVESVEALENKKTANLILFVPILKGERELCESWRGFSYFSPAQYVPYMKAIIFDGDVKYSPAEKAIVLAREYYRAYSTTDIPLYDEESFWLIEKDAQAFQHKFVWFLGGEKYQKLVYAEARRINNLIDKKKNKELGCFLPEPTVYNKQLIKIFGKPESREEEAYIQRTLWIDAMFVIIENDASVDDVARQKIAFLKSLNFYKHKKESLITTTALDYNWHYLSRQK